VYSLGMTILEAADLAQPFFAYDWAKNEIS
jgi:hypothetical protein